MARGYAKRARGDAEGVRGEAERAGVDTLRVKRVGAEGVEGREGGH